MVSLQTRRVLEMRKIFYLITVFIIFTAKSVIAADILPDNIYAVTDKLLDSKELQVNQEITLISFDSYKLPDKTEIQKGDSIKIKLIEYKTPSRGKRNGFYLIELIEAGDSQREKIAGKMRVSTPKDIKEMAKTAGVMITGKVLKVPGFSQAVAISKGLIKPNENEGRLVSAGKNLYESTPLTYIEKGEDFKAEKDGIVVLKLKLYK